jgi:prolipoprotein diacylglyceryltransferase
MFHNTAIYELLFLLVLFGGLLLLARRRPAPGTLIGVFCLYYGLARGASDFLRVNDETTLGLTGAQWMCVLLIPAGILILTKVRKATAGQPIRLTDELQTSNEAGDSSALEPASASDLDGD